MERRDTHRWGAAAGYRTSAGRRQLTGLEPDDWRDLALCVEENPEVFFPIGKGYGAAAQAERAKAICCRCEVIRASLSLAMKSGQNAGVCGGLSANDRSILNRRDARSRLA